MSHYEQRLEQDLERIHDSIREIAALVETALKDAMRALLDGDTHLANMTVLRDNRINRASRRIDRLCHAFIARHLPGAGHLRLISSVIRLNVAIERVGDYAVTISRESLQMSTPPADQIAHELQRVADESQRLLHEALRAFDAGNAELASATIPQTERIENMMDDIYAQLIDSSESRSPREIVAAFVVFSLLKRISDQAKNICEQTLFAVAGERKKTRPFNILFVDSGNNERGLMAQGIARKSFPWAGQYASAAAKPAESIDAGITAFLDSCGIATDDLSVQRLSSVSTNLQEFDIVIALDETARSELAEIPFHTTRLSWNADAALKALDDDGSELRHEALYRYLKDEIHDLMDLIADRRSDA